MTGTDSILDVDLLAFERGRCGGAQRRGRRRAPQPGHGLRLHEPRPQRGPDRRRPTACWPSSSRCRPTTKAALRRARAPTARPATPACWSRPRPPADVPDWKEMLNWGRDVPAGHPLRTPLPAPLPRPGAARGGGARHHRGADALPRRDRRPAAAVPARSSPSAIGCHESFFDEHAPRRLHAHPGHPLPGDGRGARTPRHVWAGEHGDINLITALPRATAPGLQVQTRRRLGRRRRPRRPGDHQHRDDARAAHQRGDPDRHATGSSPPRPARRALLGGPVLPPDAVDDPAAAGRPASRPSTPSASAAIEAGDALDQVLYEINLVG